MNGGVVSDDKEVDDKSTETADKPKVETPKPKGPPQGKTFERRGKEKRG